MKYRFNACARKISGAIALMAALSFFILPAGGHGDGGGQPPRSAAYHLSWYTIDGGGEMWCIGGDYELSSTIGQPDASEFAMTGGDFELTGGFWKPAVKHGIPTEPADSSARPDGAAEPTEREPPPLP